MEIRTIHLNSLGEISVPGLTPAFCCCLAEAAAVCLEEQAHLTGVEFSTIGDISERFLVTWNEVNEQALRSYSDEEVATEYGAYCIAVHIINELTEFEIWGRARKGRGFDFWLGKKGEEPPPLPLEGSARLEVSGIRHGTASEIDSRMNQKQSRILKHENELTAFVVIVEFGRPTSKVIRNERNN